MTDTIPMRRRCDDCKGSYFNDPQDRQSHMAFCPKKLADKIQDLIDENEQQAERITNLEGVGAGSIGWDPDDVAEDDSTTGDDDQEDDSAIDVSEPVPASSHVNAADLDDDTDDTYPPAIDRDDDADFFTSTPTTSTL